MGLVSCVVRLEDTTPSHDPVEGVVVRFYTAGDAFVTEETTDAAGEVDVLLDGSPTPGTTYHVRAYKLGCSFGGPWDIEALDPIPAPPPTLLNEWTMSVNVFEVANSPTPGLCRVSGYVRKLDGSLLKPANIRFGLVEAPQVLYGSLIAGEAVADAPDGYVQIDLIRGATYEVVLPGWPEISRKVLVPDRGGVLLADLLFPIPISVTWLTGVSVTVQEGETVEVTPEVLGTDYADWDMGGIYLSYAVADETVAVMVMNGTTMSVTGKAAGTTTLTATRTDKCFLVLPDRPLLTAVLTINVIP